MGGIQKKKKANHTPRASLAGWLPEPMMQTHADNYHTKGGARQGRPPRPMDPPRRGRPAVRSPAAAGVRARLGVAACGGVLREGGAVGAPMPVRVHRRRLGAGRPHYRDDLPCVLWGMMTRKVVIQEFRDERERVADLVRKQPIETLDRAVRPGLHL